MVNDKITFGQYCRRAYLFLLLELLGLGAVFVVLGLIKAPIILGTVICFAVKRTFPTYWKFVALYGESAYDSVRDEPIRKKYLLWNVLGVVCIVGIAIVCANAKGILETFRSSEKTFQRERFELEKLYAEFCSMATSEYIDKASSGKRTSEDIKRLDEFRDRVTDHCAYLAYYYENGKRGDWQMRNFLTGSYAGLVSKVQSLLLLTQISKDKFEKAKYLEDLQRAMRRIKNWAPNSTVTVSEDHIKGLPAGMRADIIKDVTTSVPDRWWQVL